MDPLFFDCYTPKELAATKKKPKQKKRKVAKIKPHPQQHGATVNKINIVIRQDKHDEHRKISVEEEQQPKPQVQVVTEQPPMRVLTPPPPPQVVEQPAARPAPVVLPAEPLFDKDELLKLLQEAAAATEPEPEPETKPPPPPPPAAKRPPASWRVQFLKDQRGFLETSLQQNKSDCLSKTAGLSAEKREYMQERFGKIFSDAEGELIQYTKTHSDTIPTNDEIEALHNKLAAQLLGGCKLINEELEKIGDTK